MKKRNIIIGIIIIILVIVGFLWQSDFFLSEEQKAEKLKEEQIAKIEKTKFATLPVITMDELEKKINNGDDVIAYFSWVHNCGDSRLFESNSFDNYLDNEEINKKIFVINLDNEAPDALEDQELRKPIAKRFKIDTWTKDESLSPMALKSPQLVHYKDGKIVNLLSWTPMNADSKYGINQDLTKNFFDSLK